MGSSPRIPASSRDGVRGASVRWLGRAGALGAGAGRRAPPSPPPRADAERDAHRRTGGRGLVQQGEPPDAVRDRAHGRGAPLARLREARRTLAWAARRSAFRRWVAPKV